MKGDSSHTETLRSTSDILMNDQQKLENNFSSETLTNKHWQEVNDYTLSANKLVNKNNAKDLFKLTQGNVKDLAVCLKKDFCGMERRNDEDAYFDDTKTPGHILQGRNLEIMIEAIRLDPNLKKELDWELIKGLGESENEKIQILAFEIIYEHDESNSATDKLLEIAGRYKGEAKATVLEKIGSKETLKDSLSERLILMNALEKSFTEDDPNTVISIVEKIKKMHLSRQEVEKVSRNICHFKENGVDDPNWKMIKYEMRGIADLDKICN